MNGNIMLSSTYRLLTLRAIILENSIKSYSKRNKKREKDQCIEAARKFSKHLRNASIIEDYKFTCQVITFGCDVTLEKDSTTKVITILGQADVLFNPRYRSKDRYLGYGEQESLQYVGKRKNDIINGWKVVKISKFKEKRAVK